LNPDIETPSSLTAFCIAKSEQRRAVEHGAAGGLAAAPPLLLVIAGAATVYRSEPVP